jgi:hypothetical protein
LLSSSFSFSLECRISSMYDIFYLRCHLFLIIQCDFHLHTFELREFSIDRCLESCLSSIYVLRVLRTISKSCNQWFFN